MLVVTFDLELYNCVEVAQASFVYMYIGEIPVLFAANCPHRGGPLQLGTIDPIRKALVCPWHGRHEDLAGLLASSVPAVRCGNYVTAVFNVSAAASHQLSYRPVLREHAPCNRLVHRYFINTAGL